MYIYKTTNTVNGKFYVGISKFNPNENKSYLGSGYLLKRAIKKYGRDAFRKEIIEKTNNKDHLLKRERYWIKKLEARKRGVGYNICEGGQWGDNWKHHPNKESYKKRCSERYSGKNNPRYNDHRTWEELCGKKRAEELKKEASIRMTENNNAKGIEAREKISKTKIGMKNINAVLWILKTDKESYVICGGIKRKLKDLGIDYQHFKKTVDDNVRESLYHWILIKIVPDSIDFQMVNNICEAYGDES